MRRPLLLLLALLGLAGSASALAQAPPPAPPPPPPAQPPPPAIPGGRIQLIPVDGGNHPIAVAFPHQRLRVLGVVRPYIAGQAFEVKFYVGHHLLGLRWTGVSSAGHNTGHFHVGINLGGRYQTITIRARHPATPLQALINATPKHISVIPASAPFGSSGPAVRYLQRALAGQHYLVPQSGVMDGGTALAVEAFQKLTGLSANQVADSAVFARLAVGGGAFPVRYRNHGRHFEADLTHQVLAEINPHGHVREIITMSSGKPSTPTVVGNFHVYLKTAGVNSHGMVDSNYFISGYAIHGYASVPTFPASHGCLRIPIPDAGGVFAWAQVGFPVDVYYRNGGGSHRVNGNAGP